MARRMSNRGRIERMAEEAEATRKAARKTPGAPEQAGGRLKLVWVVSAPNGKAVEFFPYGEKAKAEALAARLTAKADREHFVASRKVPME